MSAAVNPPENLTDAAALEAEAAQLAPDDPRRAEIIEALEPWRPARAFARDVLGPHLRGLAEEYAAAFGYEEALADVFALIVPGRTVQERRGALDRLARAILRRWKPTADERAALQGEPEPESVRQAVAVVAIYQTTRAVDRRGSPVGMAGSIFRSALRAAGHEARGAGRGRRDWLHVETDLPGLPPDPEDPDALGPIVAAEEVEEAARRLALAAERYTPTERRIVKALRAAVIEADTWREARKIARKALDMHPKTFNNHLQNILPKIPTV